MEYVESDPGLESLRPNGRQIRNLVSTANSIAQADGRKMKVEDLKMAVKMSMYFLNYMASISGRVDEAGMATKQVLRNDAFREDY